MKGYFLEKCSKRAYWAKFNVHVIYLLVNPKITYIHFLWASLQKLLHYKT